MHNMVLKISELDGRWKNLYRNNTKKYIKTRAWMSGRFDWWNYFGGVGGSGVGGDGRMIGIGRGR